MRLFDIERFYIEGRQNGMNLRVARVLLTALNAGIVVCTNVTLGGNLSLRQPSGFAVCVQSVAQFLFDLFFCFAGHMRILYHLLAILEQFYV